MFCGKCGVQNADDAAFCTKCGAKLSGEQTAKSDTAVAVESSGKKRKVGIIAVAVIAVVAVAVIGIIIALSGGRGYKATADYKATAERIFKAQYDADVKAIVKLIPDEMIDLALEKGGYDEDELDEFIRDEKEALQSILNRLDEVYGKGWTISYEITNEADVTGDVLNYLKDFYENIGIEVSSAKTVRINWTIKGDTREFKDFCHVPVVEIGGAWYLDLIGSDYGVFFNPKVS